MAYLIKVTIAWTLFLLLFEWLYKNNARFTTNRIYLMLSIAVGLLLPAIPSPFSTFPDIVAVQDFYTSQQNQPATTGIKPAPHFSAAVAPGTGVITHGPDLVLILGIIYGAGVLLLFIKYLVELLRIGILLAKKPPQLILGHKVIETGKIHSPYSFMAYTFLTDITSLHPDELEYIIRHEAAHDKRKHWLDLWLMQLVNMFFWFHPLVWRYRHLLQMQHEYEADAIAAYKDPYAYGRFLLQQTILRGVPSITHSFHFSPIKNRINMLTKINSFKPGNWKYVLMVPALLGCTFIMAKSSTKAAPEIPGNKMSYKGNVLTWRQSDTLFYDKVRGQAEVVSPNTKEKPQVIIGINNEPVYYNDHLQTQASYGNSDAAFIDYVINEFHTIRRNTPDSATYLVDLSLVVDKSGKVVYYTAHYARPQQASGQQNMWDLFYNWGSQANLLMDKVIAQSPLWKPAMQDGKPVHSFVNIRIPGC